MKKNALIIFLLLSSVSKAQVWFDLGINGGIGTGFYTNKIFYNDNRFNLVPRIGSSASFKVGINPSEKHAVVLEIGYVKRSYSVDQAFVPGTDQKNVFNEETSFNGFQTAVLYRKTTEGTFFEIGPMWSKISNQITIDGLNKTAETNTNINSKIIRGVFGIGGYLFGNERVTLIGGVRLLYDFTDLRADNTFAATFPFQNYNDSQLNNPLHAFDFQINLELNVSLGFLYRASCGKRQVVFEL